jgi:prepilin-type processing-associated H-X9-DG protein
VNLGTWLVYDPTTGANGDGALVVNRGTTSAAIRDGLSNTLAFAEVKAYQPYLRNTNEPTPMPPISPAGLAGLIGQFKETGHTVWPDGRVHHSGITTTFTPNFKVLYRNAGTDWDIDYSSQQEGKSDQRFTYAAITSRSYHPGMVNIALMDGSVRVVSDSIDLGVWRAMGTRGGREFVAGF